MSPHVAVAHYPEGAGHATRMMAIARVLEQRGATVTLAGGGSGRRFYGPNGYAVTEMPSLNYVRDFQDASGPIQGIARVLKNSLPMTGRRVQRLVRWLRREDPDAVVTDDMFAALAASWVGAPLYVLTHNGSGLYRDLIVQLTTRGLTFSQRIVARRFFYPTVWPPSENDPPDVSRVPPVALRQGDDTEQHGPEDPGVVVVPSTYSEGFDELADRLRNAGYTTTHVGRADWNPVPAMLPILRRAEAVVCAGYSTVMEAAVAGTPCVVHPATNEQMGVADRLRGVKGFRIVERSEDVLDALRSSVGEPDHTNGDRVVTERILDDLED